MNTPIPNPATQIKNHKYIINYIFTGPLTQIIYG